MHCCRFELRAERRRRQQITEARREPVACPPRVRDLSSGGQQRPDPGGEPDDELLIVVGEWVRRRVACEGDEAAHVAALVDRGRKEAVDRMIDQILA